MATTTADLPPDALPLFTVLDAGVDTRLVDFGRPDQRAWGVGLGGAADRWTLTLGNALLGNPPDATALEVCLRGPRLHAHRRFVGVVCGAPFALRAGSASRPLRPNFCFTLEADDQLEVGGTAAGLRAYLCVAGGLAAPRILGSTSGLDPVPRGAVLHGHAGGTIAAPPRLGLSESMLEPIQPADAAVVLRVLPGDHAGAFTAGLATLLHAEYTVTPASNRMGLRLAGPALRHTLGELLSEPVVPGTIQVTHDGQPVILGIDGQTIGGYPRLAHVITADWDRLGQVRPGQRVRFVLVDQAQARRLLQQRAKRLAAYCGRLGLFQQHR